MFTRSYTGKAMIIGVGVDVVETARMLKALERSGSRFEELAYTATERADCAKGVDRIAALSSRFAAKEACLKALGVGLALEPMAVDTAAHARASATVGGVTLELALFPLDGLPGAIGALALPEPGTARLACAALAAA